MHLESKFFGLGGCGSGRREGNGVELSVRMDNGIQVIWPSSNQLGDQRVRERGEEAFSLSSLVAAIPRLANCCTHITLG